MSGSSKRGSEILANRADNNDGEGFEPQTETPQNDAYEECARICEAYGRANIAEILSAAMVASHLAHQIRTAQRRPTATAADDDNARIALQTIAFASRPVGDNTGDTSIHDRLKYIHGVANHALRQLRESDLPEPEPSGTRPLGIHANRLSREPEEKRFAEAWIEHNEGYNLLRYLLHPGDQGGGVVMREPSRRDQDVAATIIQWLGSSVGQAFLQELGYERKPVK